MTTKLARPSIMAAASDDNPAAAMMTIPDFSRQQTLVECQPSTPIENHNHRVDGPADSSEMIPAPAIDSLGRSRPQRTPVINRVVAWVPVKEAAAMAQHLRSLTSWKRHWLPLGGVAIAILWLGSVFLTDRPPGDQGPAPDGPRQAKRDPSPRPQPMTKSRLRTPPAEPRPMHRTAAVTADPSANTPSPDPQDELFGKVPTLGGFTASDNGPSESAPLPAPATPVTAVESGAAPELQAPLVAPANPPRPSPVDEPAVDQVPPHTAAKAAVDPVPTSERPPQRGATEYEWGTPIPSPAEEMRVTRTENKRRPAQTAPSPSDRPTAGAAASGSTGYVYPQTDPTTYKDPLYEIPPLARRPQPENRR